MKAMTLKEYVKMKFLRRKLQNAKAQSKPSGLAIEFSWLNNINLEKAKSKTA